VKVGILGGTFDPIHEAHVFIARKVAKIFSLDRVDFVVARRPPHKDVSDISSGYHRFAMAAARLTREPQLYASLWELERSGPSFTIKTLESMKAAFPGDEFCFIGGSDSLREIHLWKDCDKLFRQHCLVFVQRAGAKVKLGELERLAQFRDSIRLIQPRDCRVIEPGTCFLVDLTPPAVSSSTLREEIRAGTKPVSKLVHPSVYQYISKYRLYYGSEKNAEEDL
jgi:nicotinate-nucleotide adenylyltransferase